MQESNKSMSSVWKIVGFTSFICPVNTKVCAHTSEIPIIKPSEKTDKPLVPGKGIRCSSSSGSGHRRHCRLPSFHTAKAKRKQIWGLGYYATASVTSAQRGKNQGRVNKRQGFEPESHSRLRSILREPSHRSRPGQGWRGMLQPPASPHCSPASLAPKNTWCCFYPSFQTAPVGIPWVLLLYWLAKQWLRLGVFAGMTRGGWRVYQDSPRSQAADGATEGQAGKGIGSATPPVSTEGSRHPTVPSQLLLLCHQLSRDTNWPFKEGPHPKNESVKAVCLYTLTLSYCPQRWNPQ